MSPMQSTIPSVRTFQTPFSLWITYSSLSGGSSPLFSNVKESNLKEDHYGVSENPRSALPLSTVMSNMTKRQEEKAARADDAAIPHEIWDERLWGFHYHTQEGLNRFCERFNTSDFLRKYNLTQPCPLTVLRHVLMGRWIQNLYHDFRSFMKRNHGEHWSRTTKNSAMSRAGIDALHRAA
jgi:hypothetical protein